MVSYKEQLAQISGYLSDIRGQRSKLSTRRKGLREEEAKAKPFTRTKLPIRRYGYSVPKVKEAQRQTLGVRKEAKGFISESTALREELRKEEVKLTTQESAYESTASKIRKAIRREKRMAKRWSRRQIYAGMTGVSGQTIRVPTGQYEWVYTQDPRIFRKKEYTYQTPTYDYYTPEGEGLSGMSTEAGVVWTTPTGKEYLPTGTSAYGYGGVTFSESDLMSYALDPMQTKALERATAYQNLLTTTRKFTDPFGFQERTRKVADPYIKPFVEGYLTGSAIDLVEGGYEGIKEEKLKAIGIGASFFGGGFLLKTAGKKLIPKLALKYPKISATTKFTLKGTGVVYGADVGYRSAISERPFYTLGRISTTEILPGYYGLKRGGKFGTKIRAKYDVTREVIGTRGKEYKLKDMLTPQKLYEFKAVLKESKQFSGRRFKTEKIDLTRLTQLKKYPGAQSDIIKFIKKKDIILSGSIAQETQIRGVSTRRPGDIDLYVQRRNLKAEKTGGLDYARELTKILRKDSGLPGLKRKGATIYTGKTKLIEFHPAKSYLEPNIEAVLPWYATKRSALTKTPEGVKILRLSVQYQRKIVGGYTEGVTGIKPGRMKDIPAYKSIRKFMKGEEYIKVAPETYAKALVKKGDLTLGQYKVGKGKSTLQGSFHEVRGSKAITISEGMRSLQRKQTFRHELIHYKTPFLKQEEKLVDLFKIKYRLQPAEILAFGGEKLPIKFRIKRKYVEKGGGFIKSPELKLFTGGVYLPKSKADVLIKKGVIERVGKGFGLVPKTKKFKKDIVLKELNFGSGGRGLKGKKPSKISETYTPFKPIKTPKFKLPSYKPTKPVKRTKIPGLPTPTYTPKKPRNGNGFVPRNGGGYIPKDPIDPPFLPGVPTLTYTPRKTPPPTRTRAILFGRTKLKGKRKSKKGRKKLTEGLFITPSFTARIIGARVKIPKGELLSTAKRRMSGLELRRIPQVI